MGTLFALTLPGLLVLLVLFAFAETLWNRLTGGRALPWTRGRTTRPVSAAGFEEVAALFQGSKHHEFEQRQSALMHREDGTDGDPPWVSVDPDANKVVLRRRS
ncbi:DUF6191 domain-containing protein [Rhodococcus qingshengii]|uniref:Uncharacterized protein n=1 Tax=Rhodococcus erythropolis TaxID=1833 RepID=A0A7Z6WPQ3_RHOER|nr:MULTISPECIES: DUF6191 domain-containing protein [Rhodococcus]EEN86364.1 hypothetical protein RHOER0001_4933 [Rhodococcus erythropolis SK121]MBH5144522.1 hypothetical protein [Rhodococcus erythropolis]NRH31484.1 hypothetical protein [Rhodococcus sp. MS13]REK81440.1 hypothetical protein DVG80_19210 [Rhodococcus erythropolis]